MKIQGKSYHSIWLGEDKKAVYIIDQRFLPFKLVINTLRSMDEIFAAIRDMQVRGAPLIGVAAAYAMYFALLENRNPVYAAEKLKTARPTAINLFYAVDRVMAKIFRVINQKEQIKLALEEAEKIMQEELDNCRMIGKNGLSLLKEISKKKKGEPVHVLTHCNAGWLACVDYGTATAPIYAAHNNGIALHVWVDETRPRNQGARLTAFELGQEGVPHTVIADNTGGYLMQQGMVDIVIVGCDHMTKEGDVVNKIGTYLKALAAKDNNIPFYVALPQSTIEEKRRGKSKDVVIEERQAEEVSHIEGWDGNELKRLQLIPEGSPVANYGFDITPARLITGIITEKGVFNSVENMSKK